MQYITNRYINKYNVAVSAALGWTKEDLLQNIRIAMWKGIATFDSSKKFKVETYLSSILENYFNSLAKRCRSSFKHKMIHIDTRHRNQDPKQLDTQMGSTDSNRTETWLREQTYRKQFIVDPEQPDALLARAKSARGFMERLTELEALVLEEHVVNGKSIPSLAKDLGKPRNQITRTVKSIRIELKHHLRREEDDGENL